MIKRMYAYGWILGTFCMSGPEKPCSKQNWIEKNDCPRIIEYYQKIGKVCATCMHYVAGAYCSLKRKNQNESMIINFEKYIIDGDIFQHTCRKWTNTYEDREPKNL